MDWVIQIGLVELALGGLLGWAMVMRAGEARAGCAGSASSPRSGSARSTSTT